MKLSWVSRKEYEKELKLRIEVQKELEHYKEVEELGEYEWLIQLTPKEEECEGEYITVTATHFETSPFSDFVYAKSRNELVGKFSDIEYYVRIDKAEWH